MDVTVKYADRDVKFCDINPVDYVEGLLSEGQWYEIRNLEFIRNLQVTGNYVDVGAYIGTHSLFFSLFCPSTRVDSIEVNPTSYAKLLRNLEVNGVTNCYPHNIGVSNVEGQATLRAANETNRGATHLTVDDGSIHVVPLDSLKFEDVRLLKIDVEGLELRVLQGAVNTLLTVEHLFVEMWSEPQSQDRNVEYTYPKVVEFLELHGFQQDQELDDRLYHFVRKDSNKVIQSLWVGDSLSTMERLSLASFLKNGHEVHLYTYGNVSNVPAGVVIKDAAEIVPTSLLDYRKFPKLAYFADMFRYKLLRERGGWWVDTDTVCIRPFDFKEETIISSEMTKGGKTHPNNGNLKAPLGSPIMTWLWNECMNKDPSKLQWGDTGPRLIKRAIERFKLESAVKPPETFCPIPWWDSVSLNDPTATPIIPKNAYAVHFWNEQWSSTGQDKILPQPESLYAKLVQKYDTRIDLNRVTAVIKTLFRDHSLFHCVQTLKASFPFIHIIVADGGKTSPEKEAQLKSMGVDRYITLPQDCGLSAGRNRLVEECLTPYVMLCDDDFSFTPECHIERMLDLTEVVDIAGGLVYNLRNWSLCETGVGWDITGGNFVTRDGKTWVDGTRGETLNYKGIRYERADFILNFFIAKTDVVKRVKWDNSLKFFAEHIDFCLRAKALGITSGRCLDSFVLHKAMDDVYDPSYVSIRKDYLNYRSLFEKKWGFPHPELLPGTTPTINEPAPRSTIEQAAKPVVVEPPPPPKNWHGWKEDFLQKKVDSLFKRFRFAVATIPNSGHYKQLCAIYPEHFEEIIDTPEGRRIIFVVGR